MTTKSDILEHVEYWKWLGIPGYFKQEIKILKLHSWDEDDIDGG